jgi:hypothetical protein
MTYGKLTALKLQAAAIACVVRHHLAAARNVCSGSVILGVADADYSVCSSGNTCTPKCLPGFRTSGASHGFAVVCDGNGDFDASADGGDLTCAINICSGQVWNGAHLPAADYSSCLSITTGGICVPRCLKGYKSSGVTAGFTMYCRDNGDFDARMVTGNLVCTINICSGKTRNSVPNADYSGCSFSSTGNVCKPDCPAGFTTRGVSDGFPLVCNDNGSYNAVGDTGNLRCLVNTCNGPVVNGVVNADYSSCASSKTGDTCTPVCPATFTATGASDSFPLVCHADGSYDAAADNGDLKCTLNTYKVGGTVRNAVANAIYTCKSTVSSLCTPECPVGYTESGESDGFTMVCVNNGECDAASDSGNLQCSINICNGQVWNGATNANYSSCASKGTGDMCTPECPIGYTPSGAHGSFVLVCRENGGYDAAAVRCSRLTTSSPPDQFDDPDRQDNNDDPDKDGQHRCLQMHGRRSLAVSCSMRRSRRRLYVMPAPQVK